MALLISWRILPSTPARVDSRDCWEPLVANIASMLAGVGGAAKVVVADRVREIRRRFRGRVFMEGLIFRKYFLNANYTTSLYFRLTTSFDMHLNSGGPPACISP